MSEEKAKNLKERCEKMEAELQEFYDNKIDSEYIYSKLVHSEDRSGRCNLRIDGVAEKKSETLEQYEDKVQNIFKEKLALEKIDIERLHRSKGKKE